jgi:hypothetical protein
MRPYFLCRSRKLTFTAATIAAIVAGAVRCSGGDSVQGPDVTRRDGPARDLTPAEAARLSAARARTDWVGEVHNAAMKEFTRDRRQFARLRRASVQTRCDHVWHLIVKYTPVVAERAATAIGPEIARAVRDRMRAHGCQVSGYNLPLSAAPAGPRVMSLFGSAQAEDETTDAMFPHLGFLDEVFASMDIMAQPSEAREITNSIVAEAATMLSTPDLNVVAGTADHGNDSAENWYEYEMGGGFEDLDDEGQMSLFRQDAANKWGKVGYADAAGAIMCVGGLWYTGFRVWQGLLAAAVICGIGESAIAVNQLK